MDVERREDPSSSLVFPEATMKLRHFLKSLKFIKCKAKLSLSLINHYAVMACGRVEVLLHTSLILTLCKGEYSDLGPSPFNTGEGTPLLVVLGAG